MATPSASDLRPALGTLRKGRTPAKTGQFGNVIVIPKLKLDTLMGTDASQPAKLCIPNTQPAQTQLQPSQMPSASSAQIVQPMQPDAAHKVAPARPTSSSSSAGTSAAVPKVPAHKGQGKQGQQPRKQPGSQTDQQKRQANPLSSPDFSPRHHITSREAEAAEDENVPLACQTAITKRRQVHHHILNFIPALARHSPCLSCMLRTRQP